MKRNIIIGCAIASALLAGTAGMFRGQEPPAPPAVAPVPAMMPAPPVPPAAPVIAAPEEHEFFFGDDGAWLGVVLTDVTAERARELKLPSGDYGVRIESVEDDSPAAQAGLAKGDVILEFDGERVRSGSQLRRLIRETPSGRSVTIQISRNGQTQTLQAQLKQRKPFSMHMPEMNIQPFGEKNFDFRLFTPGPRLGISGEDLTQQLAGFFGVKAGKGVLVREVESGSAAEKAGIKAGDVITRVDNTAVSSPDSLRRALPHEFEGTKKVQITIVRDRHEQTLNVNLQAPESPMHSLEREITRGREQQMKHLSKDMAERSAEVQQALAQLNRELTVEKQQQLAKMSADMAQRKADLQKAVDEATSQWTRERQRYLEETRKSLELLQRELQKQKLQQLRAKHPHEEEI